MRSLPWVLAAGAVLWSTAASAHPTAIRPAGDPWASSHPLYRLVEKERGPTEFLRDAIDAGALRVVPHPPGLDGLVSPLDCEHARHDISLDPSTGATVATLELRVRAKGSPLSSVGFVVDEGLTVGAVTADNRAVTVSDQIYAPSRIVRLDLAPALAPGETSVITVPYQGTLACGGYRDGGNVACTKGRDFSYFAHQSIFPYLYDPEDPYGYALDAMTRDIVVRVPLGTDVISTGERSYEAIEGDSKVSAWTIDKPLSRVLGMYVFAGKLGLKPVPGRSVPTTLVFPAPEQAVDQRLASWSPPVLDFVEGLAGGPLPFQKSLTLVRLPSDVGDPGTATFGMTLLSETYSKVGDLMHEETWAHENSHLFWGIVVPERDTLESRMLSEGLATLSEIDYTFARHYAGDDRDEYLARRFVPIGLDLRTLGSTLPAVRLAPGEVLPDELRTQLYTLWAYYKTSATLDHLRVTIGDDVFAKALSAYVRQCSYVGCTPDDFRSVLEGASGKDLGPFFARWVSGSERPRVIVSFAPVADGADVELTKPDDAPMTLELWIRLEDGQLLKRHVDLGPRTTRVHVATPGPVRSVAASPRHDLLVDTRSAIDGDLDFDGEADGLDVLRCTRLVGKAYKAETAVGLWNLEERFDPRCDVDGDNRIDERDIERLSESFGKLRSR